MNENSDSDSGSCSCHNRRRLIMMTTSPTLLECGGSSTDENNNIIDSSSSLLNKKDTTNDSGTHDESAMTASPLKETKSHKSLINESLTRLIRKERTVMISIIALLFLCFFAHPNLRGVSAVCVWQGGPGFRLACGFRQSGLFRLRSIGGLKGYLGAGFTIGDEDGFKDSLTNTDPAQNNKHPAGQGVVPPYPNSYQRMGVQEPHQSSVVPLSKDHLKKQEAIRYLQQIQAEQMLQQQVLQQQSAMQKQPGMQGFQKRRLVSPSPPNPTPIPGRRRSPLTKRASLWGWPFGNRKKNGPGSGPRNVHGPFHNPVEAPRDLRRPPRPRSQGPQMFPVRRGPPPPMMPTQSRHLSPPSHPMQQNRNNAVDRRGFTPRPTYEEYEDDLPPEERMEDHIPRPPSQMTFPILPNQVMVPPPPGPIPEDMQIPYQRSPVSREDISHLQLPPNYVPPPFPSHDPPSIHRGGPMQKIMGRFYPNTSPSPVLHNREYLTADEEEEVFLSGLGNLDKEALATAVYDPNIFPDIYFTTTEREMKDHYSQLINLDYDQTEDQGQELRRFDTAASLHTSENVERMDESENFEEPRKRKKGRRRRKKFRLLKKKGEISLDDNNQDITKTQEILPNEEQSLQPPSNNNNALMEGENEEKVPKRKKGRRRKRPQDRRRNNSTRDSTRDEEESETHQLLFSSSTTTTTEPTTTTTKEPKIEMATFGYHEALDKKNKSQPQDPAIKYHEHHQLLEQEEIISSHQQPYDPRFPPNHEVNKGKIPNKFIRQRGPQSKTTISPSTRTPTPFINGGINVMSHSSKPFSFDEVNSTPNTFKFSPSTEYSSNFVRFDSRESAKSVERTRNHNGRFYNKQNNSVNFVTNNNFPPTAFSNPGFYDFVPEQNQYPTYPKQPEVILPWERSTTAKSRAPAYPDIETGYGSSIAFDNFPPRSMSPSPTGGLNRNIFSGETDHRSNWEAPNFWGSVQQNGRFGASSDFASNDNKRFFEMDKMNSFHYEQPPQPPYFPDNKERSFPSYFDSTPNSIAITTQFDSQWHGTPSRHPKSRVAPTSSPTPFLVTSTDRMGLENEIDESEFGVKVEKLPVKELNFDNFEVNNFPFAGTSTASTTTTTTEIPELINDMRNKHTKTRRRKPKQPEVRIKFKGENQPQGTAGTTAGTTTTTTPSPITFSTPEPEQPFMTSVFNGNKAKVPFNVGQTLAFTSGEKGEIVNVQNAGDIVHLGFDGNFVPSTSPFPKDPDNPFANFDTVIPQNPFNFNNAQWSSGEKYHHPPAPSPPKSLDRFMEKSKQTRYDDSPQMPVSQWEQQQQQQQPSLPNIVPSPPDPLQPENVVSNSVNHHHQQQQQHGGMHVMNPPQIPPRPDHNDNRNWESERRPQQQQPHQVFNRPPDPPRPPMRPDLGRDIFSQTFHEVQDELLREGQYGMRRPPQEHNRKTNGPPSIKLVRPTNFRQDSHPMNHHPPSSRLQNVQHHFADHPEFQFTEDMKILEAPVQSMQFYKKPVMHEEVSPYQLVPADHQSIPPKNQFQKHGPPKKYMPENARLPPSEFTKSNILLPQNPYMNSNSNRNVKDQDDLDLRLPPYPRNKVKPTKIPSQKFQPPPPSPNKPGKSNGSFLSMLNPFNRGSKSNGKDQSAPPPPPPPGGNRRREKDRERERDRDSDHQRDRERERPYSQTRPKPNVMNHMNPSNTRFQPPPPPRPNGKSKGVEVTFVDLDDEDFIPPKLIPPSFMQHNKEFNNNNNRLPLPQVPQPTPTRIVPLPSPSPPSSRREDNRFSEKEKVLHAINTLNNVKYDVIQSVAEEQFGSEILERIKAQKAKQVVRPPPPPPPPTRTTTSITTPRPSLFPLMSTMSPLAGTLLNLIAPATTTPRPPTNQQQRTSSATSGLTNLLSSFGGYGDSALNLNSPKNNEPPKPNKAPSLVALSTDAITNLFNSLTSSYSSMEVMKPTPTATTTTTPSSPIMINMDSLGLFGGGGGGTSTESVQDIKSLQAQLAKAIIAKANRKKVDTIPPNPFGLLNSLSQTKNYTHAQISTLKKLIALNNIEQKINSQLGVGVEQTTNKWTLGSTLKSLLGGSSSELNPTADPNSVFSNKMLKDPDFQMLNSVQNSGGSNRMPNDPTLLALKTLALKRAQAINQPKVGIKTSQQEAGSSSDFVDLSAILSPSPPVVEEPRTRRLTEVRNAPKSFYPVNATLGFDIAGSGPGSALTTEFNCENQSFFPGLYADTGLGCKVFHLCAKTDAGYFMKSFRCPRETVFDQEVLKCNWSLFVECPGSESKYHFNKYLSQSFQFLKQLGEISKNVTSTG